MENQISLYSYAKELIKQEIPMDPIIANKKYAELADFIHDNRYTMLLCRERNDYTLFNSAYDLEEKYTLAKIVKECFNNRGALLLVDKQKDDNYEIWVRDKETKENFVYYLFDYDEGVIEV